MVYLNTFFIQVSFISTIYLEPNGISGSELAETLDVAMVLFYAALQHCQRNAAVCTGLSQCCLISLSSRVTVIEAPAMSRAVV